MRPFFLLVVIGLFVSLGLTVITLSSSNSAVFISMSSTFGKRHNVTAQLFCEMKSSNTAFISAMDRSILRRPARSCCWTSGSKMPLFAGFAVLRNDVQLLSRSIDITEAAWAQQRAIAQTNAEFQVFISQKTCSAIPSHVVTADLAFKTLRIPLCCFD